MNTKQLTKRFNALLNVKQQRLPENEYEAPRELKIARTVQAVERLSYTDTFLSINKELTK
jgi:hypothetical protein